MERTQACSKIQEALDAYFELRPREYAPYGNGHINDTFLVAEDSVSQENRKRFILQRMNHSIFLRPDQVMENILGVTEHIREKVSQLGGDLERGALRVIPTRRGEKYFRDSIGSWWRLYEFVEGTVTKERVENGQDFYRCAEAFGVFQGQLSDYPSETLHETIPNFHNTPWRYKNLHRAIEEDRFGRAESVMEEIHFAKERADFCQSLERARQEGKLPLRVTHNDTKLNNILFDERSGAPVCVIDLDTVMPGYSVNDFGDSIRFGANTAAEDETNLSKVSLDLELFRLYAEGFLKGCGGRLTESEVDLLPIGAMMMTYECGIRFLTDYLEGDVYFKIHRPMHNLERCRNQFALLSDMERKREKMERIIKELKQKI